MLSYKCLAARRASYALDTVASYSPSLLWSIVCQLHPAALQVILAAQEVGPPKLLLELGERKRFACVRSAQ
jgi:hypothetical protein